MSTAFSTDFAVGVVNGRFDGAGPAPIDDAYAVALALAHPEQLDVQGLVVTYGNDRQSPQVEPERIGELRRHGAEGNGERQ